MAATEVNSTATRRFWDLFHALPEDAQRLAVKSTTYGDATLITLRSVADRDIHRREQFRRLIRTSISLA